jgi:hypothetical protein
MGGDAYLYQWFIAYNLKESLRLDKFFHLISNFERMAIAGESLANSGSFLDGTL